jgi:hypothetical protein
MKVAKQQVRVWRSDSGKEKWIPFRQYIDEKGLANFSPWRVHPGMTEVKCFSAGEILDCDPGGLNDGGIHSVDSRGYVLQTVRELQYSRWKKGRCAYIWYAGPHDGMYLMLPKPLKVAVEVKVTL